MRFYTQRHQFYCGVDLHARTMSVCILDTHGRILLQQTIPTDPDHFLRLLAPYRDDLVVSCECLFCWYWLADLCHDQKIHFVLGHALYMKAIHGAKTKNDKIDAHKIARLLFGGNIPYAYVYPKGMRETRDLLRRRNYLVHKRAETITHLQNTNSQYNFPAFPKRLARGTNRRELNIADRFSDPSVKKSVAIDLRILDYFDILIDDVELHLTRTAKVDNPQDYSRLLSIPGVGKTLGLVLLYEIHDISRFASAGEFLSYSRLVSCKHESAGKKQGSGGKKIGNAHLRWAFGEAACLFLRYSSHAKSWMQRQEKKRGKAKGLAILAARLARTVYHMLRKHQAFDEARFWGATKFNAPTPTPTPTPTPPSTNPAILTPQTPIDPASSKPATPTAKTTAKPTQRKTWTKGKHKAEALPAPAISTSAEPLVGNTVPAPAQTQTSTPPKTRASTRPRAAAR